MQAGYYDNILYPLQDRAINTFKDSPFYLTGGTALSRFYYHHRYSDDLDFFVNYLAEFQRLSQVQIDRLSKVFEGEVELDVRGEHFFRLFVGREKLKIELINDVPSHVGDFVDHPVMGRLDSRENILANKLTALVDRLLPKDIVDIYFLLKDGLDLKRSLLDANSKAAGISPLLIAKHLSEFDYGLIEPEIKWITPIAADVIKNYMKDVSRSIVDGSL